MPPPPSLLALPPPQVSVSVSADAAPRLSSIRSAMDALSAAGDRDNPEARQLVNEYRVATGEAKVEGVIDFLRTLPALQQAAVAGRTGAAAAAAAAGDDNDDSDSGGGGGGGDATLTGGAGSSRGAGAGRSRGKVLVFAHHQSVLDALQSRLCEADRLRYVRIDGRSSANDRQVGRY